MSPKAYRQLGGEGAAEAGISERPSASGLAGYVISEGVSANRSHPGRPGGRPDHGGHFFRLVLPPCCGV